jgi:hypothetical protein
MREENKPFGKPIHYVLAILLTIPIIYCGSEIYKERKIEKKTQEIVAAQAKVTNKSNSENRKYCYDQDILAYGYAIDFVKERLKSPSSAKFPNHSEQLRHTVNDEGSCSYEIVSWVDSQNSFGAMLRQRFKCTIYFEGDFVRCKGLTFYEY